MTTSERAEITKEFPAAKLQCVWSFRHHPFRELGMENANIFLESGPENSKRIAHYWGRTRPGSRPAPPAVAPPPRPRLVASAAAPIPARERC